MKEIMIGNVDSGLEGNNLETKVGLVVFLFI